jgi:uracil-DNA glycosylase
MIDIERQRTAIASRYGSTPHADPVDGGARAELLVLLETPGPRGVEPRFVSCDNPTGTARNLRRFVARAGIDRRRLILWNAVPWLIHAPGARNRAPNRGEIAAGLAELPAFLDVLPNLAAVVLAGRVASKAAPVISAYRPTLRIFTMPHPSPTYVCTAPTVAARIAATLAAAAASLPSCAATERRFGPPPSEIAVDTASVARVVDRERR